MIRPAAPYARPVPPVPHGGHLRVVAPCGVVDPARLDRPRALLEAAGFTLSLSPSVSLRDPAAPYLAGDDHARARALTDAFLDPAVDGVVCARGGYGAMRLLPLLDPDLFARHPKPLLGFSDVTALHGFLNRCAGIASIHGPLLSTLGQHADPPDPAGSFDATLRALRGQDDLVAVDGLRALSDGEATGPLIGGNLSLIASLVGSPFFPALDGAILFIEEVGEAAYRVDRMLTGLALRGALSALAGLVIGDLEPVADAYVAADRFEAVTLERLRQLTDDLGVPVALGLPVGHGAMNRPLPFGTRATLRCLDGSARLEVQPATLKE